MAVIKATDILAEVAKAKARVAHMHAYFSAQIALAEEDTQEKMRLSMAYSAQLSQSGIPLREYVRKLPVAVQNKQAKACSAAKAYIQEIEEVHVPLCYSWMD